MKFPVDLLADVSQTELERLAQNYMNNLLYSNPDAPEHLVLSDSTQVTIDITSVGFVPLYGCSDKQKILALFSPRDPLTAVALYLLDTWWTVDDILKTADPARDGAVEVGTVGERIVLYILNRVIYRAKEMSSEELPFLCHGEKDHAKVLWKDGEAVGFYSVKPPGSFCNAFSTRSYELPVMDSIFVRKCQRGKGFGLLMLEDFVLSFDEDCLGLRYPLTKAMYKVCEKYLSQFPGDTGLLWEVESVGGPKQRTNIASKIQAIDKTAVSRSLTFTEESLVITERTEKDVMEAITTQIKEAGSMECTVEIVEEVTVLSATKVSEAEVPLTARGRSSGSKRRKMGEKTPEGKAEKVIRIEDIEAETPREEQLTDVSELMQTECAEEQGDDVVDTAAEEAAMIVDKPTTVLAPQDPEEADVTSAPTTEKQEDDVISTSCHSQITVENVASEIEEERQEEDAATAGEDLDGGAETLDQVGEGTQIGVTNLEESVTQDEASLSQNAVSEKALPTVEIKTPIRRSTRHSKLEEETPAQDGGIILRGRALRSTPAPKRRYTRHSQKVSEELEKEEDVSPTEVEEELAVLDGEQLTNEEKTEKQQEPESSTGDPDTVEAVEEDEDEKIKEDSSVIQDKQDVPDDEMVESPAEGSDSREKADKQAADKEEEEILTEELTVVNEHNNEAAEEDVIPPTEVNVEESKEVQEEETSVLVIEAEKEEDAVSVSGVIPASEPQENDTPETPADGESVAPEKQEEEEDECTQKNVAEKSVDVTAEAEKEALEDNIEKETEKCADEEKLEAEEAQGIDIETSSKSSSGGNQEEAKDNMEEEITDMEVDEAKTCTDEVEGEIGAVAKDAEMDPVEQKKSAVPEICADKVEVDTAENLPAAEVDHPTSSEEEEAQVVETRALRRRTQTTTATPRRKSTRTIKQADAQEAGNSEEEPAVTTRALRSGRSTASQAPKSKSQSQIQEVEKPDEVEEKVEEEIAEKVKEEAASEREEGEDPEVDVVEEETVAEQGQEAVEDQSEDIPSEKGEPEEGTTPGAATDSAVPPPGEEEATLPAEELQGEEMAPQSSDLRRVTVVLVDLHKAAAEEGLPVSKPAAEAEEEQRNEPPNEEETMEQDNVPESPMGTEKIVEEGGSDDKVEAVSLHETEEVIADETAKEEEATSVDDEEQEPTAKSTKRGRGRPKKVVVRKDAASETETEESAVQVRVLRGGRKSIPVTPRSTTKKTCKQLQEEEEESTTVNVRREEEQQMTDQENEETPEEQDASEEENLETEKEETLAEGQEEEEEKEVVPLPVEKGEPEEGATPEEEEITAGVTAAADDCVQGETEAPLPEAATDSAVPPPGEEEATPPAEELQGEEMAPQSSDLRRVTVVLVDLHKAAAEEGLPVSKPAAEAEEEQRDEPPTEEETMKQDNVPESPMGTEKIVEDGGSDDKVEAVSLHETEEVIADETAKEEEATSVDDEEQEPTAKSTQSAKRRGRPKKVVVRKDAASETETDESAVQVRVLRGGRKSIPVTPRSTTKKQLQEEEEESTTVDVRGEEEQQMIDQENEETLEEQDASEEVEHPEAEKEETLAEEDAPETANSTDTVVGKDTEAADEGNTSLVAEEAVAIQDRVEEEGLPVSKPAAEAEEEQRDEPPKEEETMEQDNVDESPMGTEKIVEEGGSDDTVEAVSLQETEEPIADETAKEEEATSVDDEEQEPTAKSTQSAKRRGRPKKVAVRKDAASETETEESAVQVRVLRGGRKSIPVTPRSTTKKTCKQLQEEEEESTTVDVRGEEEQQMTDQENEETLEEQDASEEENLETAKEETLAEGQEEEEEEKEVVPVPVEKGEPEEGATPEEEAITAGVTAAADDCVQGETEAPLPEAATDSAVPPPGEEEATPPAEELQGEEMAPQSSDLRRVTVVLVDLHKAAAEEGLPVSKPAAEAEEEPTLEEQDATEEVEHPEAEKEETLAEEDAPETANSTDTVVGKDTEAADKGNTSLVAEEAVAIQHTVEGEQSTSTTEMVENGAEDTLLTGDNAPIKGVSEEQEAPDVENVERDTARQEATEDESPEDEPAIEPRVLRKGRKPAAATPRCKSKRAHTQRQTEEEEDETQAEETKAVLEEAEEKEESSDDKTEADEAAAQEMGQTEAVAEEPLAEPDAVEEEQPAVAETPAEAEREIAEETPNTDEGKVTEGEKSSSTSEVMENGAEESVQDTLLTKGVSEEQEAPDAVLTDSDTTRQADGEEESPEDEPAVEPRVLRKGRKPAAATPRRKSKRARTKRQTEEEEEEEEEVEEGQESPKEAVTEEEGGSMEIEKNQDKEEVIKVAGGESAEEDAEQTKDASPEGAAVLQEDEDSDHVSAEAEATSEEEENAPVSAEGEAPAMTTRSQIKTPSLKPRRKKHDSPRRSVRKRPRVDYRENEADRGEGETSEATDEEKEQDGDEQNISEEEEEPVVIGKRVLRGRTVPSVIITPQSKSRRSSAQVSHEQKSPQSIKATPSRKSKRLSRI